MATKRRGRTIAKVAGAGLVLYLLLRGGGGLAFGKGKRGAKGAPARCRLALRKGGLTLDGSPATIDDAVATCAAASDGAELWVSGAARYGDYLALREALETAGVKLQTARPGGGR